MELRSWEDFVATDDQGRLISSGSTVALSPVQLAAIAAGLGEVEATATTRPGELGGTESGDYIAVNLVAGQTYSFDYRGVVGGVEDPYLALFNPAGNLIMEDDDGGAGRGSLITYTPTTSGTYYLYATSYYTLAEGDPSIDTGGYTISMWTRGADVPGTTNVLASLPAAATLTLGTYYGNIDTSGDNDYFRIDLTAGQYYSFTLAGGAASNAEFSTPGNTAATLYLYRADGTLIGSNLNFDSTMGYFAQQDTTIYVRAQGLAGTTGGYTLDVEQVDLSTRDPLESLNWDRADDIDTVLVDGVPTAYVYFGAAGENFGEAVVNQGWEPHQIEAVMNALAQYTPITGIRYEITTDVEQAEFRMITVSTATYGARFYPQDPAYGSQQGIGTFNLASGGFGAYPQSLEQGGYSFAVILHEFGHAHGIAHPHDTGGGSEVMLGVYGATGSLGVYNLNQGVYTVMSYNDAWQLHPDGASAFTVNGIDNGWSGSLSAFDIAVLQERYGVHAHNTGDNVYALTDVADDAFYQTIWDTGGTDVISYSGALDARIDLTAATLDYTPTGGGVLSFLLNDPDSMPTTSFRVRGGYTIANGVVIENATGGSGNDVLLGNAASNVITGNAGDDFLMGRGGADTLHGGAGFDTASWSDSAVGVTVTVDSNFNGTASDGDRFYSVERIEGSNYNDRLVGGNAADNLAGMGGDDRITGGNGTDRLDGGAGNDQLSGDNGEDWIFGGAGNDRLKGGNGDDVLNGGAGDDILVGGRGSDLFVFADAGNDTILDYQRGEDIDLSALGVSAAAVTILSNSVVVELGEFDLTITGTRGITMSDIILTAPASATATGLTGPGGEWDASSMDAAASPLRLLNGAMTQDYFV